MFESFSIYYLHQKKVAEAICYGKAKHPIEKIKVEGKKQKKEKKCVHVCETLV